MPKDAKRKADRQQKVSWRWALLQLRDDWDVKRATGHLSDAKQWLQALALLQKSASFRAQLDSTLGNSAANACVFKTGPWHRCLHLLHILQQAGIKQDVFSCGIGAKSFSNLACNSVWQRVCRFGVNCENCLGCLSPIVWGTVLGVVGRAGQWGMALALLASMIWGAPRRPQPDTLCLNVVISGSRQAWSLAAGLLSQPTIQVDEVSFNSAMANFASNVRLVWELFAQMPRRTVEPSQVTYGTAVNTFASASEWRSALQCLCHGKWASTTPNIITFGACLNACHKGGSWRCALQLMDEICEASLQPNAPCSGAAVSSCGTCRQWSHSLGLLYSLPHAAVPQSLPMLGAAMAACEGAIDEPDIVGLGDLDMRPTLWESVLNIFRMLKKNDKTGSKLRPDLVTMGIGVSACGKGGKWPSCLHFLDLTKGQRVVPSMTLLNSVLDGLDRGGSGCWRRSLEILGLLHQERIDLDSLSIRSLMKASEANSNYVQTLGWNTRAA